MSGDDTTPSPATPHTTPITFEACTRPMPRACTHRDMAGDSMIEAINEHTWCTSCGAAGPDLQ